MTTTLVAVLTLPSCNKGSPLPNLHSILFPHLRMWRWTSMCHYMSIIALLLWNCMTHIMHIYVIMWTFASYHWYSKEKKKKNLNLLVNDNYTRIIFTRYVEWNVKEMEMINSINNGWLFFTEMTSKQQVLILIIYFVYIDCLIYIWNAFQTAHHTIMCDLMLYEWNAEF